MTRPTLSVVSIVSVCLSLSATTTFALPVDAQNSASKLAAEERMFQTSLTPRDLGTVDFDGALETEAFKVAFDPHYLTPNAIQAALEHEVFQVALNAASPAILENMQTREDTVFKVALAPNALSEWTVQANLENALFEIPLNAASPSVVAAMQTREDKMFDVALQPQLLTASAIDNALEYEVFSVAVNVPAVARPATYDDVFAVSLEPRSLESLSVQPTLLSQVSLGLDAATPAAGSSRIAAQ